MKKILFMIILSICSTAYAQTSPPPVEISATKSLEWNRKNKTYTARENATALQGTAKLQSDTITAHYDDDKGATNITTLEANNHVIISSPPYTATGDKAVYDVKTGNAVLTGQDLKIVTDSEKITAQEKIEFSVPENKLTAVGKATVTRGDDTLTADSMSAYFTKNDQEKLSASKIAAHGHITIKTAKETAIGEEGIYDISAQKAVLTGKVKIFQGQNWLEGTRAEIDMNTGISRLSGTGNEATGGRVTGMFYPKAKDQMQPLPEPKGKKD